MAYSGNWLKGQQLASQHETALPRPDPRHGQSEEDAYPNDHLAPPQADYGDTDFARTVVQTPGLPIDAPQEGHDSRGAYGSYRNHAERQAAQGRGHEGHDLGWVRATYKEPEFQDDTTRYLEDVWTGNESFSPPPEALQRGINSLPQNNPEREGYDPGGFRRGLRQFRFVDRKNKIDHRVYSAQQLLAREIRIPRNQPAQNSDFPRTSPFDSMARVMNRIDTRPGIFRNPPRLTDTILADQPPATDDGGIATDGMWSVM